MWLVAALAIWNALVDLLGGPRDSDFTEMIVGGEILFSSRWAFAFEDPVIQNGPLTLTWAGINTVVDRVTGVPAQFLFAVAVYGGFSVGAMFLTRVLYRDRGQTAPPGIELAVGVVTIISGIAWNGVQSGQPVDAIVAVIWILVARAALRDRPVQAGLLLTVAAGVKLVAVLGVPLLLLLPGLRRRATAVAVMAAGATFLYLPFYVFGEANILDYRWPVHTGTLVSLIIPAGSEFPWLLRVIQGAIVVGGGALIVRGLKEMPDVVWLGPLALSLLRIATDPIKVGYYWLAPETCILVGIALLFPRLAAGERVAAVVLFFVMTFSFLIPVVGIASRYVIALAALGLGVVAHRRPENVVAAPRPV